MHNYRTKGNGWVIYVLIIRILCLKWGFHRYSGRLLGDVLVDMATEQWSSIGRVSTNTLTVSQHIGRFKSAILAATWLISTDSVHRVSVNRYLVRLQAAPSEQQNTQDPSPELAA